jgi:hypothetical protein
MRRRARERDIAAPMGKGTSILAKEPLPRNRQRDATSRNKSYFQRSTNREEQLSAGGGLPNTSFRGAALINFPLEQQVGN